MKTENKAKTTERASKDEEAPEKLTVFSILHVILREIADFKGWELIFQVLMYGFFGWTVYNFKYIYELHTSPEYAHIPKYSITDFKFSLIMVVVFLVYRSVCQKLFYNFIKNRIKLDRYPTEEEKDAKIKICANWIGQIIYYCFSTSMAFYLFKDQEFFPSLLGGPSTNSADIFKGIPAVQDMPYAVEFYMVQFGSHLHTFIDYCVYKRKSPKFWEMFLHHSLAVFLIFFSYITGGLRAGILVLFTHDPCDIFVYSNRLISEFKTFPKILQYANYLALIVIWIFFRLFAFPKLIVGSSFDYVLRGDLGVLYSPHLSLALMLASLVILHAYWLVFILRVLSNMLKGKTNYNVYDAKIKKKE